MQRRKNADVESRPELRSVGAWPRWITIGMTKPKSTASAKDCQSARHSMFGSRKSRQLHERLESFASTNGRDRQSKNLIVAKLIVEKEYSTAVHVYTCIRVCARAFVRVWVRMQQLRWSVPSRIPALPHLLRLSTLNVRRKCDQPMNTCPCVLC